MTPQEQAAQDAANAAKYPTPLPPNDPASVNGARNDANYIGPTNFGNIQKQYTPYQIEQATERRGQDIFWKQGVNIADIPAAAPLKPPSTIAPMPATAGTTTAPGTTTSPNTTGLSDTYNAMNQAAGQYLTGISKTIDDLKAQQQAAIEKEKATQEAAVGGLKNRLTSMLSATTREDARAAADAKFQIDKKIADLTDIQSRIGDAQNALTQGLIFEEGRPVRMALLTGRASELQKQGLAKIQSLQTTAEIIKGNLDLAKARADSAVADAVGDVDDQKAALNTLLELENTKLISLSEDEKDILKDRMTGLKDQATSIEKNKNQIFDLATSYPTAFAKGGVTFLDSPEEAIKKMLPTMSAQEQEQYNLDIQAKKAALAKKTASGGSGSGGGATGSIVQRMADDVSLLKSSTNPATGKPFTDQEIRLELLKEYGGELKTTELNAVVDQALQGTPAHLTPQQEQANRVLELNQDYEAKGISKLNSDGTYSSAENAAAIKAAEKAGLIKWNGSQWWSSKDGGTPISDPSTIQVKKGWLGLGQEYVVAE